MSQAEKRWAQLERPVIVGDPVLNNLKVLRMTGRLNDILDLYGPKYIKGIEIGNRLKKAITGKNLGSFRPPVFSLDDDQGEAAGFGAAFGIPPYQSNDPRMPLSEVALVMHDDFATPAFTSPPILHSHELLPEERLFMSSRLPAVRFVPVAPDNISFQVVPHPSNPFWAPSQS